MRVVRAAALVSPIHRCPQLLHILGHSQRWKSSATRWLPGMVAMAAITVPNFSPRTLSRTMRSPPRTRISPYVCSSAAAAAHVGRGSPGGRCSLVYLGLRHDRQASPGAAAARAAPSDLPPTPPRPPPPTHLPARLCRRARWSPAAGRRRRQRRCAQRCLRARAPPAASVSRVQVHTEGGARLSRVRPATGALRWALGGAGRPGPLTTWMPPLGLSSSTIPRGFLSSTV